MRNRRLGCNLSSTALSFVKTVLLFFQVLCVNRYFSTCYK